MLDTTTIAPLVDPIVEQYKDNHLESLSQPYPNEIKLRGGTSAIKVSTYSGAEQDVIVIIKNHNDQIVRNSYLRPGASVNMDVPSGTYQMFLYYGNGWCPEKVMPNGLTGGFVCDESFSKDDPVTLEQYQYVEYSLTPTTNGNFQTKHTDKNEVF